MKKVTGLLLLISGAMPMHAFAEIAVIGHPDLGVNSLTVKDVKRLFLCQTNYWSEGKKIVFSYQAKGSEIKKEFDLKILGKSSRAMKKHWAKLSFTGQCKKVVKLESDTEVRAWVKATPKAIGYIDADNLKRSDKVLLRK